MRNIVIAGFIAGSAAPSPRPLTASPPSLELPTTPPATARRAYTKSDLSYILIMARWFGGALYDPATAQWTGGEHRRPGPSR